MYSDNSFVEDMNVLAPLKSSELVARPTAIIEHEVFFIDPSLSIREHVEKLFDRLDQFVQQMFTMDHYVILFDVDSSFFSSFFDIESRLRWRNIATDSPVRFLNALTREKYFSTMPDHPFSPLNVQAKRLFLQLVRQELSKGKRNFKRNPEEDLSHLTYIRQEKLESIIAQRSLRVSLYLFPETLVIQYSQGSYQLVQDPSSPPLDYGDTVQCMCDLSNKLVRASALGENLLWRLPHFLLFRANLIAIYLSCKWRAEKETCHAVCTITLEASNSRKGEQQYLVSSLHAEYMLCHSNKVPLQYESIEQFFETLSILYSVVASLNRNLSPNRLQKIIDQSSDISTRLNDERLFQFHTNIQNESRQLESYDLVVLRESRKWKPQLFLEYLESLLDTERRSIINDDPTKFVQTNTDRRQNRDLVNYYFTFHSLQKMDPAILLFHSLAQSYRAIGDLTLRQQETVDLASWKILSYQLPLGIYKKYVIDDNKYVKKMDDLFLNPNALQNRPDKTAQYQFQPDPQQLIEFKKVSSDLETVFVMPRPRVFRMEATMFGDDSQQLVEQMIQLFYPLRDKRNLFPAFYNYILCDFPFQDIPFVTQLIAQFQKVRQDDSLAVIQQNSLDTWSLLFYNLSHLRLWEPFQWKEYFCLFLFLVSGNDASLLDLCPSVSLLTKTEEKQEMPESSSEIAVKPVKRQATDWQNEEKDRLSEFVTLYKQLMQYGSKRSTRSSFLSLILEMQQEKRTLEKIISFNFDDAPSIVKRLQQIETLEQQVQKYLSFYSETENRQRTKLLLQRYTALTLPPSPARPPLEIRTVSEESRERAKKARLFLDSVLSNVPSLSDMCKDASQMETLLGLFQMYVFHFCSVPKEKEKFSFLDLPVYKSSKDRNRQCVGRSLDFIIEKQYSSSVGPFIWKNKTDPQLFSFCYTRQRVTSFGSLALELITDRDLDRDLRDPTSLRSVSINRERSYQEMMWNQLLFLPRDFAMTLPLEFFKQLERKVYTSETPALLWDFLESQLVENYYQKYLRFKEFVYKHSSSSSSSQPYLCDLVVSSVDQRQKAILYVPLAAPLITEKQFVTDYIGDFSDFENESDFEQAAEQASQKCDKYILKWNQQPQKDSLLRGVCFLYAIISGFEKRLCAIELDVEEASHYSWPALYHWIVSRKVSTPSTPMQHLQSLYENSLRIQQFQNFSYKPLVSFSDPLLQYASTVWWNNSNEFEPHLNSWFGQHLLMFRVKTNDEWITMDEFVSLRQQSIHAFKFVLSCFSLLDQWATQYNNVFQTNNVESVFLRAFMENWLDASDRENGFFFMGRFYDSGEKLRIATKNVLPRLLKTFVLMLPADCPIRQNDLDDNEIVNWTRQLVEKFWENIQWIEMDQEEEKRKENLLQMMGQKKEDDDDDEEREKSDDKTVKKEKRKISAFESSVIQFAKDKGFRKISNLVSFATDHPPMPIDKEEITGILELASGVGSPIDTDGSVKYLWKVLNRPSVKTVLEYLMETLFEKDKITTLKNFQSQPESDLSLSTTQSLYDQLLLTSAYLFGYLQQKSGQKSWNFYENADSWKNVGKKGYLVPVSAERKRRPEYENESKFGKLVQSEMYESFLDIIETSLLPTLIVENFSASQTTAVEAQLLEELVFDFFQNLREIAREYVVLHDTAQRSNAFTQRTKEERDNSVRRLVNSDLAKYLAPSACLLFSKEIEPKSKIGWNKFYTTFMKKEVISNAVSTPNAQARNLSSAMYLARYPDQAKTLRLAILDDKDLQKLVALKPNWTTESTTLKRVIIDVSVIQLNQILLPSANLMNASKEILDFIAKEKNKTFSSMKEALQQQDIREWLTSSLVVLVKFRLKQSSKAPESHAFYEPVLF